MKAAIAAMIYAGKVLQDLHLTDRFSYMVCATVQKEPCKGLAWEYLIEEEGVHPDFVIIAEPSDDRISPAQKGRMELKISVAGQSAHVSAPTLTTWPFSTNGVAIMGKHGIPVIGFGPGVLAACHVPDEYVKKEQVLRATMMYAAMCITYSNKER